MREPSVVLPPRSIYQLKKGFDHLAHLLALTLGPSQGVVISTTDLKPQPELLTDAATIARRITDLPDPEQNMGAMLLRNLVWRMRERVGDGSALAAVLAQSILERAMRGAAAGANVMSMNLGIRQATEAAVARLGELAFPVQGEDELTAVARSATGLEELSWVLGEMFDILGPNAHITVEEYVAPYLERVYLDGGAWKGSLISPYLITAPALGRAVQTNCRVTLYDGTLSTVDEVRPLLACMSQLFPAKTKSTSAPGGESGKDLSDRPPSLLLVAQRISGEALSLLTATHQQTALKVVAVSLKRAGVRAQADLQDLAWLTGAALISPVLGRRIEQITLADLGSCQRAEAGTEDLVVTGGAGDMAEVRRQIELLNRQLQTLPIQRAPISDDSRVELEMRLGRLSGSAGILKVGAISQAERDFLRQRAEQGVRVLRGALQEGVLPGGGSAYLHAIRAVEDVIGRLDGDAAIGARALRHALEAPFGQILANAGISQPRLYQAEIQRQPPGLFYDVQCRQLAEARQAGVLDSAQATRAALETAASGAMMALSTDTLIVKRKPRISYEP